MVTINFPNEPADNEIFTFGDRTWQWSGNFWRAISTTVGYTGSTGYVGSKGDPGSATNPWQIKTANYLAIDGDRIIADSSFGGFTITLPGAPAPGYYVQISDGADFDQNPVVVSRNGSTIEGYSDNVLLDLKSSTFEFIYSGTTWQITSTTGPLGPVGYTGSGGSAAITLQQPGRLLPFAGTARWYAPFNCSLVSITPRVRQAANRDINISIFKNTTFELLSQTIPSNSLQGTENTSGFALDSGEYLTVSVLQAGTQAAPGVDLYLQVVYIRA